MLKLYNMFLCQTLVFNLVCAAENSKINNCRAAKIKFENDRKLWPIFVDKHCDEQPDGYRVSNEDNKRYVWEGIYEAYGRSGGSTRYEMVLTNGTTFKLMRGRIRESCHWFLARGTVILFRVKCHQTQAVSPPQHGWIDVLTGRGKLDTFKSLKVTPFEVARFPLLTRRLDHIRFSQNNETDKQEQEQALSSDGPFSTRDFEEDAQESALLREMLHPAVSRSLGEALHNRYTSTEDRPVDSISIDGLFNSTLLQRALGFMKVPIDKWVGPETAVHCCKDKYRLSFQHWRNGKWDKALQSLASNRQFISFLEGLTGISGLIPMRVQEERLQWAGSNVIGVASGGFLYVHNDFNQWEGLHRRINVLFYLNKDWKEEWGGHLELWDRNSTRCVHRIRPEFNRMSIFTVTDDAFHGHPEPLTSPPDVLRYGLQIVYYTQKRPVTNNSPRAGDKRPYDSLHGAIFQAPCADHFMTTRGDISLPGIDASDLELDGTATDRTMKAVVGHQLRNFCGQVSEATHMQLVCECDFRSS